MSNDLKMPDRFTRAKTGQRFSRLMAEQKNRTADGLHRLAGVVRKTAARPDDVGDSIGNYRYRAAARMDSIATYMRGADIPTMLRDAGRFARRPEVVVVGTIVTGRVLSHFLKPSRRRAADPWSSSVCRWNGVIEKGAQIVSAAADTLREGADTRGLRPEAVIENVTGSRLANSIALIGDRLIGGNIKAFGHATTRAAKKLQEEEREMSPVDEDQRSPTTLLSRPVS